MLWGIWVEVNVVTISFPKPKTLVVVLIILIVGVFFLVKAIVNSQPTFIENCSVAKVRHLTNIPKGSVYYRSALDRDNDGIACNS